MEKLIEFATSQLCYGIEAVILLVGVLVLAVKKNGGLD